MSGQVMNSTNFVELTNFLSENKTSNLKAVETFTHNDFILKIS